LKLYTSQERIWAGNFGNEHHIRNDTRKLLASKEALLARILKSTPDLTSVIEFGSGIGLNLRALRNLCPGIKLAALDINRIALNMLCLIPQVEIIESSIYDFHDKRQWEMVLSSLFLIHIPTDHLHIAYEYILRTAAKYICLIEYWSPKPMDVIYRSKKNMLWKRDFASELLQSSDKFRLADYGFVYHLDPNFPLDDVNWFLLERFK